MRRCRTIRHRRGTGGLITNTPFRKAPPIAIAKSFFRYGKSYNPPCPPLEKGGNYKELLLKSPFEKGDLGGFKNRYMEGIYGKRYTWRAGSGAAGSPQGQAGPPIP